MSEIKVNKISPRTNCGTVQLGDSGDTITIPSGATITNNGTANGFGATGAVNWQTTVKTGDFTAVAGEGYFVNTTSGAITVTLPSSPSAGAVVGVKDYANTWDTNNCTLARNGSNIGGEASDSVISTEGLAVTLVYVDGTKGWLVTDSGLQSEAPGPQYVTATGGNTTITCGDHKIHIFTGPGNFQVTCAGNPGGSSTVDYLVVAGGGSGGNNSSSDPGDSGGGGGAGGMRYSRSTVPAAHPIASTTGISVPVQTYPITVGAGGAAQPSYTSQGNAGSNSVFSSITSAGGGGGGAASNAGGNGGSGGGMSGGGQGSSVGSGNTPPVSPPQGNNGGRGGATANGGSAFTPDRAGGGGGGAGAVGGDVTGGGNTGQGAGGAGAYVPGPWFGPTSPTYGQSPAPLAPNGRYFAGGGGGTSPQGVGSPFGAGGGAGGGGSYCNPSPDGLSTPGIANTGGGGGGAAAAGTGFAGGSGFVAIRYKFQN